MFKPERTSQIARLTGALLLVMTAAAIFAEGGVRSSMFVAGDIQATVANITASPGLFRAGLLGYLIAFLIDVPVAVLLYFLLKEVDVVTSALAAAFRLVYTGVVGAALLAYAGAVVLIGSESYVAALGPEQFAAQVYFMMDLFDIGFSTSLVFFAGHLALLGYLLIKSGRVPKALGGAVLLGGIAYAVSGSLLYLAPSLNDQFVIVVGVLGMAEVVLALWLVVRGWRQPKAG